MGIYDTYGEHEIQLKVGDVYMSIYKAGDKVPIADGVYLAPDGVVVVIEGKLALTDKKLTSKWGVMLSPETLLKPHNPYEGVAWAYDLVKKMEKVLEASKEKSTHDQALDLMQLIAKAYAERHVKET